jgi:hypothetical protein
MRAAEEAIAEAQKIIAIWNARQAGGREADRNRSKGTCVGTLRCPSIIFICATDKGFSTRAALTSPMLRPQRTMATNWQREPLVRSAPWKVENIDPAGTSMLRTGTGLRSDVLTSPNSDGAVRIHPHDERV